jgi:YebC/PmpR family DNA-binding regulatory protein
MSGHSKWATIKRKKGAKDAARGKLFSKLIKEVSIAARQGGGDPGGNPRLRAAIDAAKAENMPSNNIERAVKRGTGEIEGVTYEEGNYEGYGPGGVALLVEAATDNRNRTTGEVRHLFTKHGGNLGEVGCVAWIFESKGVILIERAAIDEEKLMELAVEAGADDVSSDAAEVFEVLTSVAAFEQVKKALSDAGIPIHHAEMTKVPQNTIPVDEPTARKLFHLIELIEDNDDVQKVFSNFQIDDSVLAKIAD